MPQDKDAVNQPPDFIAYQVGRSPEGTPIWSTVLVGVGWTCPDGTLDIQFSTMPVTGLVKLRPHNKN